jgi:hypothetical protein
VSPSVAQPVLSLRETAAVTGETVYAPSEKIGVPTPRDGEPGIANQLVPSVEDIEVGHNRVTLYPLPTVTGEGRVVRTYDLANFCLNSYTFQ